MTLATAYVHVKNKDNIAWFFHCINAVINLVNVTVMCDRGRIQDAVKLIWLQTGVSVQLRFCKIHILHNLKRSFGFSGSEFRKAIWKLQSA